MNDDKRPDGARRLDTFPLRTNRAAVGAHRSRWESAPSTIRATLNSQFAGSEARPEWRALVVNERRDEGDVGYRHDRNNKALVGTASPDVTRQVSAPGTSAVESPRSWRTPSVIRLKPWTYASERPPPDVLMGSRPPSSNAPSSVKLAPSPGPQNPYPSRDNGTRGVKAS